MSARRSAGALGGIGLLAATLLQAAVPAAAHAQAQDDVLALARRAVVEGRAEEALALLEGLSAEHPDSSEIALWRGHAMRRADRPVDATQQYLRALRLDPANAGALIALGDLQDASGNLAAARERYEAAAAAAPRFPLGFRKAAGIAVRQNRHAEAIALLERYLALRPRDVAAIRVLGMQQYLDEDVVAAQATFERALGVAPDDAEAHFGLGLALADEAAEQERALQHLRTALAAAPANAMALYTVGRILAGQDDFAGAATAFESSLAIDERQSDAHYRLALAYARLGRRDEAREHQTRFREL